MICRKKQSKNKPRTVKVEYVSASRIPGNEYPFFKYSGETGVAKLLNQAKKLLNLINKELEKKPKNIKRRRV